MRVALVILIAGALLGVVVAGHSAPARAQQVTPIVPAEEQSIDVLTAPDEQAIAAMDPEEAQRISDGTNGTPTSRGLAKAGKVAFGVVAAALGLAATAASLLFL